MPHVVGALCPCYAPCRTSPPLAARVQNVDEYVIEEFLDQRKAAKARQTELTEQLRKLSASLETLSEARASDRNVLNDLARRRTEADERILNLQAELGEARGNLVVAEAKLTAAAANAPAVSLTTTLAAKPPKVFTGVGTDGPKLRSWKTSMTAFLNATKVPGDDWALTAVTYLSDAIQDQWARFIESKPAGFSPTWNDLLNTLTMWYSDDDPTTGDIMRALSLLRQRQKETVAEFVQRFEHKATELATPLDKEFKFDLMIGGMREPLKEKLQDVKTAMQKGFWKSTKDFRESATRFEKLLEEREQVKKDMKTFTDPPPRNEANKARKPWKKVSGSPKPLSPSQVKKKAHKPDRMKPNEHSKAAKRQKLRDEGRCFICQEKGHLAKDCPQKKDADKAGSSQDGRSNAKQSFQ